MDVLTIWESDDLRISQARNIYLPGYLVIERRGPTARSTGTTRERSTAIDAALELAKSILRDCLSPMRIYELDFANSDSIAVLHVIPGNAEVMRAVSRDAGFAPETQVEIAKAIWEAYGMNRTIYSAVEILNFVAHARAHCRSLHAQEPGRDHPPLTLQPTGLPDSP